MNTIRGTERLEQELENVEKQLKQAYLDISAQYKCVAKVRDEWRLTAIQNGIDGSVLQTMELRAKAQILRKQIMDAWTASKNSAPTKVGRG